MQWQAPVRPDLAVGTVGSEPTVSIFIFYQTPFYGSSGMIVTFVPESLQRSRFLLVAGPIERWSEGGGWGIHRYIRESRQTHTCAFGFTGITIATRVATRPEDIPFPRPMSALTRQRACSGLILRHADVTSTEVSQRVGSAVSIVSSYCPVAVLM